MCYGLVRTLTHYKIVMKDDMIAKRIKAQQYIELHIYYRFYSVIVSTVIQYAKQLYLLCSYK